ncbi:MAG: hypothetical protein ACWA5L_09350 [bacterium]
MTEFAVIIVNYNTPAFTYQAAMSALGALSAMAASSKGSVIIVDNHSTDGSVTTMESMLADKEALARGSCLPDVSWPRVLPRTKSFRQNDDRLDNIDLSNLDVVILAADKNGGFAAGNNIGLRLLEQSNAETIVLLNPDAQLSELALSAFEEKLKDERYGLVGATVLSTARPYRAQALGGAQMSRLTLLGQNIGAGAISGALPSETQVEARLDYPLGAAIAFRRDWLQQIGLMDERYFLYYEEMDWARAGRHLYKTGWARAALVYHAHGASAGSNLGKAARSNLADYYMIRSRLAYATKWCPWCLPHMYILGCVQALRRLPRRQFSQARAILRAMIARPFV